MLAILLACLGGVAGQASQFYVAVNDKGASDDNDGACAVYQGDKVGPWRTIQRALRVAQPGDTVFVGSGRYAEEVSITTPRIRLRAIDGARPLIDGENADPTVSNPDASAEEVLIEGFEIANHTSAGVMIGGRGSRGVTLRGNIVHHARDKGITVRGTGHRIESNVVFMIGNNQEAMGIHLASASDCLVQDNDVFLCKKTAIRDQSGKRNTIQGNLMHQCWTVWTSAPAREHDL
jgi:parallel beta-helix repeat protein